MEQVLEKMNTCNQTQGMTVYQHGVLVHDFFNDLYLYLKEKRPLQLSWKLPEWIDEYGDKLLDYLLPFETLKTYQIFHDIGKPFCRVVDSEGKQHFPDHAKHSKEIYYNLTGDETISTLIGMDMDIHLLKSEGVEDFCKRKEAVSLLLTGLSELHANASMFGGIQSISFLIKYKSITKNGKRILKKLII